MKSKEQEGRLQSQTMSEEQRRKRGLREYENVICTNETVIPLIYNYYSRSFIVPPLRQSITS